MAIYISEVDWLPDPPADLVDDLQDIVKDHQNHHFDTSYPHIYASYETNPMLEAFYQQYFDYAVACRYQVIGAALGVHIDNGLEDQWKYNYLFDTGGSVDTMFWSSVDNPTLLYRYECKGQQWYHLNVSCPHSTSQPTGTRFSLVIRKR